MEKTDTINEPINEPVNEPINEPISKKSNDHFDKMPPKIYQAIDWNRCFIGGSYALKQYLGKDHPLGNWSPSDVDIFGDYDDYKEFTIECQIFQKKQVYP